MSHTIVDRSVLQWLECRDYQESRHLVVATYYHPSEPVHRRDLGRIEDVTPDDVPPQLWDVWDTLADQWAGLQCAGQERLACAARAKIAMRRPGWRAFVRSFFGYS